MNRINRFIKTSYQFFLPVLLFLSFHVARPLFAQETSMPSEPFEKYNVILVFIDTLRADHLSCYGYPRETSPNIDRLVKESTIFEQNFAPATYTLPSFMSINTSIYPNSHGVLYIYKDKLSSRITTLAQILKIYGYKTAWLGPLNNLQLKPEVGFGRGFDELVEIGGILRLDESRIKLCNWLDANKDQRFFLNFYTCKVHAPYLPSPEYKTRFTKIKSMEGVIEDAEEFYFGSVRKFMQDKKLAVELLGEDFFNQFQSSGLGNGNDQQLESFFASRKKTDKLNNIQNSVYWAGINLKDKSINDYLQTLYDACILEYDEEVIGPIIKKLKALNIYDKTIIIVTADHGEEFYEHGGHSHGTTLYDEVTRVPLIIHVPWIKQAKRVKELTQTVDILPTLLDLLAIPIPHQAQGKSLIGLMSKKKSSPPHEYVFGSMGSQSFIRSKEWSLVLGHGGPDHAKLYNLRSDPGQQKDIYPKNKDMALKLEFRLKEWEASLPSYKDQEYSFPPEIDKATQERIRKTGYW
jgi:arylsulfatase A-like enzyme